MKTLVQTMKITYCFAKIGHGLAMRATDQLTVLGGRGIEGDVSANPVSPRQILIASGPTLLEHGLVAGSIQENVVVDGIIENFNSGQLLQVGTSIIRLTYRCEPCFKLDKVQAGLARRLYKKRGFLGRILSSGTIRLGDTVSCLQEHLSSLSDDSKERLVECITHIPSGTVATLQQLTQLAGVAPGYVRALPSILRKLSAHVPTHRVVSARMLLMSHSISNQKKMLLNEGVLFTTSTQVDERFLWDSSQYFANEEKKIIRRQANCGHIDNQPWSNAAS